MSDTAPKNRNVANEDPLAWSLATNFVQDHMSAMAETSTSTIRCRARLAELLADVRANKFYPQSKELPGHDDARASDPWAEAHLECNGCGVWCPGAKKPERWTEEAGRHYCYECSVKRAPRTNDAKPIGTPKHTCRQPSDAEIEAGNVSYDLHCAGCIALLIHIRGSLLPVALFDARVDNAQGDPVDVLEKMAEKRRIRAQNIRDDSDLADSEAADDDIEHLDLEVSIIERCISAIRGARTDYPHATNDTKGKDE